MKKVNLDEIIINDNLYNCVIKHMEIMEIYNSSLPVQLKELSTNNKFALYFSDFLYKFSYKMTQDFIDTEI